MKAIRINQTEIHKGGRHIDILVDYQVSEGLTDDQVDAMITAGTIEFGSVFWDSKAKRLEWSDDSSRNAVYTSIDKMIEINGRPI